MVDLWSSEFADSSRSLNDSLAVGELAKGTTSTCMSSETDLHFGKERSPSKLSCERYYPPECVKYSRIEVFENNRHITVRPFAILPRIF